MTCVYLSTAKFIFRNLDWLYSTAEGRQQIISDIQYSTVAFIFLQSDQEYRDLSQVQNEMTDAVLDFKPSHITNEIQVEMDFVVF